MNTAARASLLLVSVSTPLADQLSNHLENDGFEVIRRSNNADALLIASSWRPDLIILEWTTDDISGVEACRQLRCLPATADVPIIMLSDRGSEQDRIFGRDAGADEYVVKPSGVRDLAARVEALLERGRRGRERDLLTYADVELDPASHRVRRGRRVVSLSPTEFSLLKFLLTQPERVFSRVRLLAAIWGIDTQVERRTVDAYIRRLRGALTEGGEPNLIRTVRFAGYSLDIDSSPE